MHRTRRPGIKFPYIGAGIGVGAALGLVFGLLLSGDTAVSVVLGAAAGLGAGCIWDLDRR